MINYSLITVFDDPELGLKGNTAAVILVDAAPDIKQMQAWAADFNQPATTYLWPAKEGHYHVRWFAPDGEIDLCGHGSLAAAAFLDQKHGVDKAILHYRNGHVKVGKDQDSYYLWIDPIEIIDHGKKPEGLEQALGLEVHDYFSTSNKDIVLLKSEKDLREMKPDFNALKTLEPFGYTVTAPGDKVDFVSRTLVPKVQQLEDHATGSSHAILCPFWSERLQKNQMEALQLSPRGGAFHCEMHLNQVLLKGNGHIWAEGELA